MGCEAVDQLNKIGSQQIAEMDKCGAELAMSADCAGFFEKVRMVEGAIRMTYAAGIECAKHIEDLQRLSDIWSNIRVMCETTLRVLRRLNAENPGCGDNGLYDVALDYLIAADHRYAGLREEMECRDRIPKGLFPELT